MCGIAVYLGTNIEFGRRFGERANGMLKHRGPDDEGIFTDHQIAMGHRRLAIVDLSSAGHQPMVSPDKRWVIAYNGEIYNHLEIRQTLCKGWDFQSRSDTETLLAALAINGPESLESMVGMWAFALWDSRKQQLLISRDRYGQKPLYWRCCNDGSLRLASEIRPLIDEGEHPIMYATAVAEYLATGNYGHLGERTFFRDIYSLPPAHWAIIKPGDKRPSPVRYWRFPVLPKKERRPYDETVRRQFRDGFEEAVTSQLMSDVPVGATLSGGLDSSAVVGAMVAHGRKTQIPIFTAQAPGSAFDESRYVKDVEKRWSESLQIHWVSLEKMPISSQLQETIRIQEEPFGDPSICAHGMLMTAARKAGVPVILGGQGGDELLFGYPYMRDSLLATWLREGKVSSVLTEARILGIGPTGLVRMGLAAFLPEAERRARQHSRQRKRYWLTPMLRDIGQNGLLQLASAGDASTLWLETVERTTLPHLTQYDDRNGMAKSIEGRMPFLDHRLADVVCSTEQQAFLNQGLSKRILREACEDFLPQSVLKRRDKIGFFTPLGAMLQAERHWVLAMLSDDYARALDLFNIKAIKALLEGVIQTHSSNIDDVLRVWRALSVRVWAETFSLAASSNSDQALEAIPEF
jgi:asparagine synthase (glutamine-hydrolysing)